MTSGKVPSPSALEAYIVASGKNYAVSHYEIQTWDSMWVYVVGLKAMADTVESKEHNLQLWRTVRPTKGENREHEKPYEKS